MDQKTQPKIAGFFMRRSRPTSPSASSPPPPPPAPPSPDPRQPNKHRGSGWNPEWAMDPKYAGWLYHTEHGMFCRICRMHRQKASRGPSQRPFIELPCTNYRRDALDQHLGSTNHISCVGITAQSSRSLPINEAFQPILNLEHEAIIGGFKCLYWLVKHEIAHHTNYPALLDLADLLGCEYFAKLKEAELKKDPVARGLYTYCATYRFVAAVHLQSDILPYLAQLSKLFQKEDINFMAIKNHVPVTIETLRIIKAAGERQPEGSFLAQVEEKVANLNIL
ncbi:uncharacterized protein LOC134865072 [Eleginops maclovinus]|uniref:uncharacterized protein LOC134865072 n=1 Tax=Eleginops maclovinus TaxID=56733 RepID=UPI00308065B9